ncbi:hypothetical protein CBP05_26080 [Pseudomonas putida]|nr:hypothetical protein CBP05_26080 [Pseudomonas putida]
MGGGHTSGVGHRPPCRSGFTREEAGPAGQSPPAVHRCRRHRIRGLTRSYADWGWAHYTGRP